MSGMLTSEGQPWLRRSAFHQPMSACVGCVGLTGLRSRHVRRTRSAGSGGTRVKELPYCGGTWTTRYRRPASDIDSITRLILLYIPGDRAPIAEKRPFRRPAGQRAGVSHAARDSRLRASSRKPWMRQVPCRLPITNAPLAARPLEWCRTLSIGTVALTSLPSSEDLVAGGLPLG